MPKKRSPQILALIENLTTWREAQGLSQSQAVKALHDAGVSVTLDSLQNWEIGRYIPNAETALTLHAFFLQQGSTQKPTVAANPKPTPRARR